MTVRSRSILDLAVGMGLVATLALVAVGRSTVWLAPPLVALAVVSALLMRLRCPNCRGFVLFMPSIGLWGPIAPKRCGHCDLELDR